MKQNLITNVVQAMLPFLNNAQTERLQEVLQHTLFDYEVTKIENEKEISEQNYMELFLSAKRIEGCSEKSLKYYKATIEMMIATIGKSVKHIDTNDIRRYLTEYQEKKKSSKVTIDNIRRILSSFFSWLEDEDYILKSPVRRIHKVKTGTNIKDTYSDEALELMRDNCTEPRDLAMIDMLASTGMRVGEMVLLNRNDIDFNERECIVFGKGNKERVVYFDARTKIHLQNYLNSRTDDNLALFVSLKAPHERLKIGGIETRLREFGKQLGLHKVHPHKFRRNVNDNLANTEQAILVETVINNHTVPTALGDLVDFIDGDRGKNYPTFDEFTSTGYCLFLNASNVTSTGFNFDNCMFVSEEKDKLMNKGHLSPYDIVLTSRGTLGNVALYDKHIKYENVRINSGMLIIRPKTKRLSPYFIYALLKSSYMKAAIERFKSGSAQPQLPIKDLQKITFEIPESDTVLVALDRQFLAVEESISINNNEIGNLKELSNVLLAELSR